MLTSTEYPIGCVVMAAGMSRRFGENKLAVTLNGVSLLEHALRAIPADRFAAVCVVTRSGEGEALAARYGFSVIHNDRPDLGLSRTIRLGTEVLQDRCHAIMYLVADQPLLRRESVSALLACARMHPQSIVAAAENGKRGNPCLFPASFFSELCALTGDTGGSAVIRAHEDSLLLFELEPRELHDVDTPKALEELKQL